MTKKIKRPPTAKEKFDIQAEKIKFPYKEFFSPVYTYPLKLLSPLRWFRWSWYVHHTHHKSVAELIRTATDEYIEKNKGKMKRSFPKTLEDSTQSEKI